MVILDTSFLFALFVKEDDFHKKALVLAQQQEAQLLACSFLVFQELMTLLMSKVGSVAANKIGQDLLDPSSPIQFLKIDEEFFADSWSLFRQLGQHRFSFVDISLLVLAKNIEAEVLTFDRDLEEKLRQAG